MEASRHFSCLRGNQAGKQAGNQAGNRACNQACKYPRGNSNVWIRIAEELVWWGRPSRRV